MISCMGPDFFPFLYKDFLHFLGLRSLLNFSCSHVAAVVVMVLVVPAMLLDSVYSVI